MPEKEYKNTCDRLASLLHLTSPSYNSIIKDCTSNGGETNWIMVLNHLNKYSQLLNQKHTHELRR